MNNISPLIPIIIFFLVGINLIESLIKFFIGRNEDENKQNKGKNANKSKEKKEKRTVFNSNWSIKNKSKNNEEIKEEILTSDENNEIDESYFRNKKGRMADYMDNEEKSIYESVEKAKVKRRKTVTEDFPNEIKIGENSLFDKDNIKGDILKGIVMKEILDKPRAIKPYKTPYKK